jgi:uncharacterized protein YndB with AHSA1/START domain
MYTTTHVQLTSASPAEVYQVCLDPMAVAAWMVPDGMTGKVHEFDARVGGEFRISLTYNGSEAGKSGGNTDTFHGRFTALVPDREVSRIVEFETDDPAMKGQMQIIITLADAPGGGTEIHYRHTGVPDAIPRADNETGARTALQKLAALAEGRRSQSRTR